VTVASCLSRLLCLLALQSRSSWSLPVSLRPSVVYQLFVWLGCGYVFCQIPDAHPSAFPQLLAAPLPPLLRRLWRCSSPVFALCIFGLATFVACSCITCFAQVRVFAITAGQTAAASVSELRGVLLASKIVDGSSRALGQVFTEDFVVRDKKSNSERWTFPCLVAASAAAAKPDFPALFVLAATWSAAWFLL
jgi:hypothetical protein